MISLKIARERLFLTQGQLASRVGIDQTEISKLEIGKRQLTVRWAVRLANALDIDAIELLEWEIDREKELFHRRELQKTIGLQTQMKSSK